MPVGVVRAGEEAKWEKAKKLAADQGRAKDWPYINGIFQRMVGRSGGELSKSDSAFDRGSPNAMDDLRMIIRNNSMARTREYGQVPTAETMRQLQLMDKPPKPWHISAYLDRPRMTPQSVVDGLGFDRGQEQQWRQWVKNEAAPEANEVALRQKLLARMMGERLDTDRRQILFERVMGYHRLGKSLVRVWEPEQLRKAVQAVQDAAQAQPPPPPPPQGQPGMPAAPTANGAPADEWQAQAVEAAVAGKVGEAVGGVHLEDLASLVKQYGPALVGQVLQKKVNEGSIKWTNGLLYPGTPGGQAGAGQPSGQPTGAGAESTDGQGSGRTGGQGGQDGQ